MPPTPMQFIDFDILYRYTYLTNNFEPGVSQNEQRKYTK